MQGKFCLVVLILAFSITACQPWLTNKTIPTIVGSEANLPTSPVSPILRSNSPVATPSTEVKATPSILTPVNEIEAIPVVFKATDGTELHGTLFGQGKTAVVIIHSSGESEQDWATQAKTIAAQGFTVLTYDLRRDGDSGKVAEADTNLKDLKSAINFVTKNGTTNHILLGVGESGILAIKTAAETKAKGVVIFSTPLSSGSLSVTAADLQAIGGPKLFIDTEQSPTQPAAVQMFDWSNSPKTWRFLPGKAQGAEMYNTDYSQNLTDFIATFFLLRLK